jgi:hypothetical protein
VGYAERVADPDDPLRAMLQAARRWQVPPTVFIRKRTNGADWTDEDTSLAMVLEDYEAGLCPGGPHPLAETTKPEHEDAYRQGVPLVCHYCRTQALIAEVAEKNAEKGVSTAGVLVPIVLDPDVVERNKLPVPPLPPELAAFADSDPT